MTTALNLLVVTESAADLNRILLCLQQADFAITSEQVATPEALRSVVRTRPWDMVIYDDPVSHVNPLEVVTLLTTAGIKAPVIVISRTVDEGVAAKALRSGVRDWFSKETLERLVPVVERELQASHERERRQRAETEASRAGGYLTAIADNIPVMLFVKDAETLHWQFWSRAGEELVGFKHNEWVGKTDHDYFSQGQADFFHEKDREVLAKKELVANEEPIQTSLGERVLYTRKVPVLDEQGEPKYLLGISEDITERKRAEADLEASKAELERTNRQLEHNLRELEKVQIQLVSVLNQLMETESLAIIGQLSGEVAKNIHLVVGGVQNQLDALSIAASSFTEQPCKSIVDSVEQVCASMQQAFALTGELERLAVPANQNTQEAISVKELCRQCVDAIGKAPRRSAHARRPIVIELHGGGEPIVVASRKDLEGALLFILSFLCDRQPPASGSSDPLKIRIGSEGELVCITVLDSLLQLSPKDRIGLFALRALHSNEDALGSFRLRVGMALARQLLHRNGALLKVERDASGGTEIGIQI